MKTTYFLLICFSLTMGQAQKQQVPQAVLSAFKKHFPQAGHVSWDFEQGHFEAVFQEHAMNQSASFSKTGKLLETETQIDEQSLPDPALSYLKTHYQKHRIKEASRVVDAKNVLTFEAEVEGRDMIFDSKGNFIKVEEE